jgi:hypothetical protein
VTDPSGARTPDLTLRNIDVGSPCVLPGAGDRVRGSRDREQPHAEGDPAWEENRENHPLYQACPVMKRRGFRADEHRPHHGKSEEDETRAERVRRQAPPRRVVPHTE